LLSLFNKIKL